MADRPSANEWDLSRMPAGRRADLELALAFDEIASQLNAGALVEVPTIADAWNKAPPRTVRATFKVNVDKRVSDLFYNGISGLRALYWASPGLGDAATATAIRSLRAKLSQVPVTSLRSDHGVEMTKDQIAHGLDLPSAKAWVDEIYLYDDGESLEVERWRKNNCDPRNRNPDLWRCTPRAPVITVMTAWLTGCGDEWIPADKRDRARQIHCFGFS
jgi:hypothetical protein